MFQGQCAGEHRNPGRVNKVDDSAFSMRAPEEGRVPEGRTALGTTDAGAWNTIFRECDVKEVALPSTLREIGPELFVNCGSLRTVRVAKGCEAPAKQLVGKGVKVRNV